MTYKITKGPKGQVFLTWTNKTGPSFFHYLDNFTLQISI